MQKPKRTKGGSAVLVAASLFTIPFAKAQDVEAQAWLDFARNADANSPGSSPIIDYSYAGYEFSEEALPNTDSWDRVDVTDFGANGGDQRSDHDAIQRAIDAAEDRDGPTVVFFPPGRYITADVNNATTEIRISRSNIVLKGSGTGANGTEIYAQEGGGDRDNGGPFRYVFAPSGIGFSNATAVTKAIARGDFEVEVQSTSGLSVGQFVRLHQISPRNIEPNFPGRNFDDAWDITGRGMEIRELHRIDAIRGNRITFKNPVNLIVPLDSARTFIQTARILENVGAEDILFSSGWGQFPGFFKHHEDQISNSGWNGIRMQNVANAWIRDCEFKDWNNPVQLRDTLATTVEDILFTGKKGHGSYSATGCYGALFQRCVDRVVNDERNNRAGHNHGPGLLRGSTGSVFVDCVMNPNQPIDIHGNHPYGNLYDRITGGQVGGNGGSLGSRPHSGPDLAFWNFTQNDTRTRIDYDFWPDGVVIGERYVDPIFIGFRSPGSTVTFKNAGIVQNKDRQVYPSSLFDAQRQLRLRGSYVSASNEGGLRPARDANDGDSSTYWRAAEAGSGQWISADLGTDKFIERVNVDERGENINRYSLQRWTGSTWETFHRGNRIGRNKVIIFRAIQARRIRLLVESHLSGRSGEKTQISEFNPEQRLDVDNFYLASSFDAESDPNSNFPIQINSTGNVVSILNGSWIRFGNFNFGERATDFTVNAGTSRSGGRIDIRADSPSGDVLGRVDITNTGSFSNMMRFTTTLNSGASGIRDLYFVFVGSGTRTLFDVRSFEFGSLAIRGYTFAGDEGTSQSFSGRVDVAFGENGRYFFRRNVTGTVPFTRDFFGGDPIPGVVKRGFSRPAQ